jgi:hypothetical protein
MSYPTCGGGGGPSGGPNEKRLYNAAYTASPYSIDDAMTQITTREAEPRPGHRAAGQARAAAEGVVDVVGRPGRVSSTMTLDPSRPGPPCRATPRRRRPSPSAAVGPVLLDSDPAVGPRQGGLWIAFSAVAAPAGLRLVQVLRGRSESDAEPASVGVPDRGELE